MLQSDSKLLSEYVVMYILYVHVYGEYIEETRYK
jgi:hypothetical protein